MLVRTGMSKKIKKEGEPITIPDKANEKVLINVIYILDSYRSCNFIEFSDTNSRIMKGDLGGRFRGFWLGLMKVFNKMARNPENIEGLDRLNYIRYFCFPLGTLLMLGGVVSLLVLLVANIPISIITFIPLVLYLSSCAFFILGQWLKIKIGRKITEHYNANPDILKKEITYLKNLNQRLINQLIRVLKHKRAIDTRFKLEKYKFRIFNSDYSKLNVLKSPGRFRKKYLVIPIV